jgi:3',5'-cyclic AMP phosphodiesterase CpdA
MDHDAATDPRDDRTPDGHAMDDRRSFLRAALAAGGALAAGRVALGDGAPAAAPPAAPSLRTPGSFRIAHLTDIHVQPELGAEAGLAAALAHAQLQKPDLVLTGGDSVMDVFEAKRGRADGLRKLFLDTMRRECSVPLRHAVGNHDILGWNKGRSGMTGSEPDWGKKFACDMFGIERTYHTFDAGGWRFVFLDGVQPRGDGYCAYLDDAQWDWLQSTVRGTPAATPICVVSHIPIMSLTTITYGKPRGRDGVGKDNVIHAGEMHTDAALIHDLFKSAGNVKLCLSGHIHLVDRCTIDGVAYVCDGAVSGSWWKGPLQGVPEGFGVVDLRPDGTFEHRYEAYGWKARS